MDEVSLIPTCYSVCASHPADDDDDDDDATDQTDSAKFPRLPDDLKRPNISLVIIADCAKLQLLIIIV